MQAVFQKLLDDKSTYKVWKDTFAHHNATDETISFLIQNEAIHLSFIDEFIKSIYHRLKPEHFKHIILQWKPQALERFSLACIPSPDIVELYVRRGREKLKHYSNGQTLNTSFVSMLSVIEREHMNMQPEHIDFFLSYPGTSTQKLASYILLQHECLSRQYLLNGLKKEPLVADIYVDHLLHYYDASYYPYLKECIDKGLSSKYRAIFEKSQTRLLKMKMEDSLRKKNYIDTLQKI